MKVALIGCGAVVDSFYLPALTEICRTDNVEVVALYDPVATAVAGLKQAFVSAAAVTQFDRVFEYRPHLAIVASPPRFHAEQSIALLDRGIAVLCEKPIAGTVAEAEKMVSAARRSRTPLAIGLFRRFFPSNQTIREIIRQRHLGLTRHFEVWEGAPFHWPAQSASFFEKSSSGGGVLADLGVHVLDLITWWLGTPLSVRYCDDAMGGLEANCRVDLTFAGEITGIVRLSRDTHLPNQTRITCDRGSLRCNAASAESVEIEFNDVPFAVGGRLVRAASSGKGLIEAGVTADFNQSFINQLRNVLGAIRGDTPLFVPGEEGLASLRIIEECYQRRSLMPMPWLTMTERERAAELSRSNGNRSFAGILPPGSSYSPSMS